MYIQFSIVATDSASYLVSDANRRTQHVHASIDSAFVKRPFETDNSGLGLPRSRSRHSSRNIHQY